MGTTWPAAQHHTQEDQNLQHVRTQVGSRHVMKLDLTQFSCVIQLCMLKYFLLNSCCLLFSYLYYASWCTCRFMFHMHADGCRFSHTIHLCNSVFIFWLIVKKLFIFIQQNVSTISPVKMKRIATGMSEINIYTIWDNNAIPKFPFTSWICITTPSLNVWTCIIWVNDQEL